VLAWTADRPATVCRMLRHRVQDTSIRGGRPSAQPARTQTTSTAAAAAVCPGPDRRPSRPSGLTETESWSRAKACFSIGSSECECLWDTTFLKVRAGGDRLTDRRRAWADVAAVLVNRDQMCQFTFGFIVHSISWSGI
jgi:hypothetical protein